MSNDKWKINYFPHRFCSVSELILVLVFVEAFFFDNVQFDGIEADDFQLNSTLFTINYVAFVRVGIDVNVGFAFRTCSGRPFSYLHSKFDLLPPLLPTPLT